MKSFLSTCLVLLLAVPAVSALQEPDDAAPASGSGGAADLAADHHRNACWPPTAPRIKIKPLAKTLVANPVMREASGFFGGSDDARAGPVARESGRAAMFPDSSGW